MIEIDGTAYPLEPGQTYLLVVKQASLPSYMGQLLSEGLKAHGIKACVVVVADVADVVVKGPVND